MEAAPSAPGYHVLDDDVAGDDDSPQGPAGVRDGVARAWSSVADRVLRGPDDEEPATVGPLRDMLLSSWLNVLLVFVPIGLVSHVAHLGPVFVFASNAAAIVPLSVLLTEATERIAAHAGDSVGALLNISLGNLVELILFVALANGHVRIVQASILGSVLVNLLLILGSALLVSGVNNAPTYNTAEAQLLACLLFVSVFAFLVPSAFDYTFAAEAVALKLSRISSLLILAIYVVYLVHEIRSHAREPDLESPVSPADAQLLPSPLPPTPTIALPPRTIRFADEGERPGKAGPDDELRGRRNDDARPAQLLVPRKASRSLSLGSRRGRWSRDSSVSGDVRRAFSRSSLTTLLRERDAPVLDEGPGPDSVGEMAVSLAMLILTSGLMSMSAELLVDAIDDVTHQTGISESVIGLIILPIVGNIAEYVTVVVVAAHDKLDLAIAVSVGSCIQIALCVTPLTVLAGWAMRRDLALTFTFFEMATLLGGVLLANLLILNESSSSLRTSGLKGALILGAYFAPVAEGIH